MPKFTAIPLEPVQSSQLKEVGYDPASKTLAVRFNGRSGERTVYTYANVGPELYDGLRAADKDPEQSVGKYFGLHVKPFKDLYPFTKIVETDEEGQPS